MKGPDKSMLYGSGVMLLLGLIAVVNSTYAWLGVSRVPFVSDMDVSVITESALLIAPDEDGKPGEWGNVLDASALLENMTPLKPVTYTPDAFCMIVYDDTGRTNGVEPLSEENINVRYPTDTSSAARAAAEEAGYMLALDFWMKCDGAFATVYLSDAVETADGQMGAGTYVVGAPSWDSTKISHQNGGHGSEATIRLGFECTPTNAEGDVNGHTTFTMYEPNANIHYNGATDYWTTESVNGGALIEESRLVRQNASSWKEQDPILEDAVIYEAGKFLQDTTLFTLDGTGMMKVRLYIWMEGQDKDCIAAAVADEVSVAANIQFGVKAETKETGIVRR